MQIKVEVTVEVDADEVRMFQDTTPARDIDIAEFVRGHIIAAGVQSLEQAIILNAFEYDAVRVVE